MPEPGTAQLPEPGEVIGGKYLLERIIGQGGMGAVFAARHVKLGHAVAIKVMLADSQNEEAARRFINEGRACAPIQNDHVVRIFDIDEERGYAYMVLELLQGDDLAQVLEAQGPLAPHVAVGYVIQALEGVRQAHELGIVHRDLKPSNLFLARLQGGRVVVKVLDFGISKARGASALDMAPHQQTSTAAMLGSPLYMSPEQLRSSKNVDARADIWAIGVILYELLTGAVPFEGETLGALFSAILESDAPAVSTKNRDVPPGLDAIVARCLQRRPEDRFATAADLARELAPFASDQPQSALPLAMTAAMRPAVPFGAHISAGPPAASMRGPMSSPAAGTGYAIMAHQASTSNPHLGAMPGHVPLGAVTPQPYQQTGNTWQSTGSATRPKGSIAVIVALCGFALLGIAGIVFFLLSRHRAPPATQASAATGSATNAAAPASANPTPPNATTPASIAMTAATAPTTPASSATPATSTAGGAESMPATKRPPVPTRPTAKVEPKPSEVAKVDPPPPSPSPPPTHTTAPAPTPTSGVLQGGR